MLKRWYILLLLLISISINKNSKAQNIEEYVFEQSNSNYQGILGGTVLGSGTSLESQLYLVALPFSFSFDDAPYTYAKVCANGFISLGSDGYINQNPISNLNSSLISISPLGCNLNGTASSDIRVLATGAAPSRVYTIEWRNMDVNHSGSSSLTFQIKLFESTNQIRFSYSNCQSSVSFSAEVGIRSLSNSNFQSRSSATGNWNSTTLSTSNTDNITSSPGNVPSTGLVFSYSIPQYGICTPPVDVPTSLSCVANYSNMSVSFEPLSNCKYLVVRTNDQPLNTLPQDSVSYTLNQLIGNGQVVYNGHSNNFSNFTQHNTWYRYTVFAYYDFGCENGPIYNTSSAISNRFRSFSAKQYTFIPTTGSANFQSSGSWFPARYTPMIDDTLIFSGGNVNVTNVPDQEISVLRIDGNGHYSFDGGNCFLSIRKKLKIETGSELDFNATIYGGIQFVSYQNATAEINGKLNLSELAYYDATYSSTSVFGEIKQIGPYTAVVNNGNKSNLTFEAGGTYIHARDGGNAPTALFKSQSIFKLTGIETGNFSFPTGTTLGHFIYDCPNQQSYQTTIEIDTVLNNYRVVNTNGKLIENGATKIFGDFIQDDGKFAIEPTNDGLSVYGNTYINGGIFNLSSFYSNSIQLTIYRNLIVSNSAQFKAFNADGLSFSGALHQDVNFGSGITGSVNLILNNAQGVKLVNDIALDSLSHVTIINGHFDANAGHISYHPTASTLEYSGTNLLQITSVEWPDFNGPSTLRVNLTGTGLAKQLQFTTNKEVNNLDLAKGLLLLNSSNLLIKQSIVSQFSNMNPLVDRMIVVNGIGRVKHILYPNISSTIKFPMGTFSTSNVAQATGLDFYYRDNAVQRTITVGVLNATHPSNISTNYLKRYWTFQDDGANAIMTYSLKTNYLTEDIVGDYLYFLPHSFHSGSWQSIGTIYETQTLQSDTLTTTAYSLANTDYTGTFTSSNVYQWSGAINNDFQLAGNWVPARTTPLFTDWLKFSTGQTDTVINVPTQTIARLSISNSTCVTFSTASANQLKLNFCLIADSTQLVIDQGSRLIIEDSIYQLTLNLGHGYNQIAGVLEMKSGLNTNYLLATGGKTEVTSTGTFRIIRNPYITSNTSSLKIYGNIEYQVNGTNVIFPSAYYAPDVNVQIHGKCTSISFTNMPTVNDILFNLNNQTTDLWVYYMPNVKGTCTLESSGTARLRVLVFNNPIEINNFHQLGGSLDFVKNSSNNGNLLLAVAGTFNQEAGLISYSSSFYIMTFDFNGQMGQQVVNLVSTPTGGISYKISNPDGILLNMNGGAVSSFNVTGLSEIAIATQALQPITTSDTIKYSNGGGLNYITPLDATISDNLYPAQFGPHRLIINSTALNGITLPFDRSVKSVTMSRGNLILNEHILTIGDSTANGVIYFNNFYQRHHFVLSTGGIKNWATSAIASTIPILYNGFDRSTYIGLNTSTSLLHKGSISIRMEGQNGFTSLTNPIIDGVDTVINRINPNWIVTAEDGLLLADSSFVLKLAAVEYNSVENADSSLHIIQADTVAGLFAPSQFINSNYWAVRNRLSLSDLTNEGFSIGSNEPVPHFIYSVSDGDWNNPATWNIASVPNFSDNVLISEGDHVTVSDVQACKSITISVYSELNILNSLTVADSIVSFGKFYFNGTSVDIGNEGGGKAPFINNGIFEIEAGICTINGYIYNPLNSTFIQNGGEIVLDGNAGGNINESLTTKAALTFSSYDFHLNDGTIKVIDPIFSQYTIKLDLLNNQLNFVNPLYEVGNGHILILGDGISTDTTLLNEFNLLNSSYNSSASSTLIFSNIILNGTPGQKTRFLNQSYLDVLHDFTMNNDGALYMGRLTIGGNIAVNEGAVFENSSLLFINRANNEYNDVLVPQYVTGQGTFISYYNTNLSEINVRNTSYEGVVFQIGDVKVNYRALLLKGKLNFGQHTLTTDLLVNDNSNNVNGNGWLVGKYSPKNVYYSYNKVIPLGTLTTYLPVEFNEPAVTTQGAFKISINEGDHPLIAQSSIDSNKSLNYYFQLEKIDDFNFSPNLTMKFRWPSTAIDTLSNELNFKAAILENGIWTTFGSSISQSGLLTINNISNEFGTYQLGESTSITSIYTPIIQPVTQNICNGESVSFAFNFANNQDFNFKWQHLVDGIWVSLQNDSLYNGANQNELFISHPPLSIDSTFFRCIAYIDADSIISNESQLLINTVSESAVSISTLSNGQLCQGSQITFNASISNAGSNPIINWYRNNNVLLTNSLTLSSNVFSDNDQVRCVVNSSDVCPLIETVQSNSISVDIVANVTPTVTINAPLSQYSFCENDTLSYSSIGTNMGTNPLIQWYGNGELLNSGASINSVINSDTTLLYCTLTSNLICVTSSVDTSQTITLIKKPTIFPIITITNNDAYSCIGEPINFVSNYTHGGTSPAFVWSVNGNTDLSNTDSIYVSSSLQDGDEVLCTLVSSEQCVSSESVYSNTLEVDFIPVFTPHIEIHAMPGIIVNEGTSILYTSTIDDIGILPIYIWRKNGIIVGNEPYYLDENPASGDIITLELESTFLCNPVNSFLSDTLVIDVINHISNQSGNSISIYPNPSNGQFVIKGNFQSHVNQSITISIHSLEGKNVFNQEFEMQTNANSITLPLNVTNVLSNGIYFLSLKVENANLVQKLIITN